jgi:hypothetical protein
MPSETSQEKEVIKWSKAIKYGIANNDADTEVARSIEKVLQFIAGESGLGIEKDDVSLLDLSTFVVSDISTFAPSLRKPIEQYFQDAVAKKGLKRVFKIEPALWDQQYRTVAPKCAGINLVLDSVVERALMMVQHDQSPLCIGVGLGELFGLTNIRKYYADHGGGVSIEIVALAFRALYDGRVKAGMSQADAHKIVAEVCK